MDHALFIYASYGASALGLGALTLWLLIDNRTQSKALADLEARGVRRRSDRSRP
ncbi:heme exporter protein CcmD [Xanthobacter sp. DSM 24535]|uniref:heme exporter protein CcmD n=1 Tax=Roseixanthobacter psychrophilus TaxID=3119917 RepID=UPI003726A47C